MSMPNRSALRGWTIILCIGVCGTASAQWTNRYPKVEGYGHQVYLEGYELPLLTNGPVAPTVSADGSRVAFASRGWIWVLERATGTAHRVTAGGGLDARPAFSPDGHHLAFVRDEGNDTKIISLDLRTGEERVVVDTGTIDLDPTFTPDGSAIVYSSAAAGDIDVWIVALDGSEAQRVTDTSGLEVAPRPTGDGGYVYLHKTRGGVDQLRWHRAAEDTVLGQWRIASQARPALSADGRLVAINVPASESTHLLVFEVASPATPMRLAPNAVLPITPTWSPDGSEVLFSEADAQQRMRLYSAPITGGPAVEVPIKSWDWGAPTATVRVRTRLAGSPGFSAARLSAWTGDGHPLVAESGMTRLDGQSGWPFFYSGGDITFTVPAGQVNVTATQGLSTPPMSASVDVSAGDEALLEIDLASVWPGENDWASGDHHFHLNYGGAYDLPPEAIARWAAGEGLAVPTSLTANLHNRYEDARYFGWSNDARRPLVRFGQEIRSHFLGHLGLIGTSEMIWPWIWGPGYDVYGRDDRPNADVLAAVREAGGIAYYVHPANGAEPFSEAWLRGLPTELIADAVLGDLDALEVVCLWTDEDGTAALWHRFLNLGLPVAPIAGTDVMTNLVRTMAIGTTRVYVHQPNGLTWDSYLAGLKDGRSFVTNGPLVDFRLVPNGTVIRPGDVVPQGRVEYELTVATATEVETIDVLINGVVVASEVGLAEPGSKTLRGHLDLPAGGWVAARASGGKTRWPAMDSYPWAHTAPIWIGEVGSTEPSAQHEAASELLAALDVMRARLESRYGTTDIPRLRAQFDRARQRLIELGARTPE